MGYTPVKVNIAIIGPAKVGKTQIARALVNKDFQTNYQSTPLTDYLSEHLFHDEVLYSLHIMDTSGNPKLELMCKEEVNKADIVIVVFDLSNEKSYQKLSNYCKYADANAAAVKLMIGTHADSPLITMDTNTIKCKANFYGYHFFAIDAHKRDDIKNALRGQLKAPTEPDFEEIHDTSPDKNPEPKPMPSSFGYKRNALILAMASAGTFCVMSTAAMLKIAVLSTIAYYLSLASIGALLVSGGMWAVGELTESYEKKTGLYSNYTI